MSTRSLSGEIAAAKELLLWLRKERISVSTVQIGEVSLHVTLDHRIAYDDARAPSQEARKSIIEEYGSALFDPPATTEAAPHMEPTIEDEDDSE